MTREIIAAAAGENDDVTVVAARPLTPFTLVLRSAAPEGALAWSGGARGGFHLLSSLGLLLAQKLGCHQGRDQRGYFRPITPIRHFYFCL